jgi:peptidoglycan/xylan/chitin deacetylase (PgdA/CDA1 family)
LSTALFIDHMRALRAAGWHTVTLSDFERYMRGEIELPDKSFVLTFDDGRKDAFYSTDPVLKDFGFNAVMFVITGLSLPNNGPDAANEFYLSKSELAYMARSGRWELQSHGDQDHRNYVVPAVATTSALFISGQHFLSNKFWVPSEGRLETDDEYAARISGDLATSKKLIEEDFNVPVTGFAYPFNDFGQESINFPESVAQLRELVPAHYPYVYYQTWAGNGDSFNHPDPDQRFIKRIEPSEIWSSEKLLAVLEGGRTKPLPYVAASFGDDWTSNWGKIGGGDALSLAAASSTTGASAFLDGTMSWSDYTLRALARIENGTVSLIARRTESDEPYAVCAFSGDSIYLERHIGQVQETLARQRYAPPPEPAMRQVSMSVTGDTARCSAYGVTVASQVPSVPSEGGVGVSMWDPSAGDAQAELVQLAAEPL